MCNISQEVQYRTKVTVTVKKEVAYAHFRLAPKSMTLDELELPKRHSCRNKIVCQSTQQTTLI